MNKMVLEGHDPNIVPLIVKMVSFGYHAKQTKPTLVLELMDSFNGYNIHIDSQKGNDK